MAKKNYQSYTLKFGGGYESADFLKHLGFKSKYIDVRSDSMIYADFDYYPSKPLNISTFPKNFFDIKL